MSAVGKFMSASEIAALERVPESVFCVECNEEIWARYGLDGQSFCRDCIDRSAWLANARAHSEEVRRHGA